MRSLFTFILLYLYALPVQAQNPVTVNGDTRAAQALLVHPATTPGNCQTDELVTPYDTHQFFVDTNASYHFEVTEPVNVGFGDDTVLLLYETLFDPANPCTNFLFRYDNYNGGGATQTLSPSKQYILVGNGLYGDSEDSYQLRISGPSGTNILLGTLPVELVSFTGLLAGEEAVLRWETASETNNAGFDIEQQGVEGHWSRLAFVSGHGTTLEAQRYEQRIPKPAPGLQRFRLKQIDYDGAFTYSSVVEITIEGSGHYHLSEAQPNPFNQQTRLSLHVTKPQWVNVAVYDALGRQVETLFEGALVAGQTRTLSFDSHGLPAGLYLVRATGETFTTTRQVMRLR